MKLLIVVVLVFGFFVIRWTLRMQRKYRHLLSDDHLIEFLQLVPHLKSAALAQIGEALEPPDDSRIRITDAGLAVFYSVQDQGGGFLHHVSLSYGGGPMVFAAGGRFLYSMLRRLGTLEMLNAVAHTDQGITHGVFVLSHVEQGEFAGREMRTPTDAELLDLRDGATRWLHAFQRSRLRRSEQELLQHVSSAHQGH